MLIQFNSMGIYLIYYYIIQRCAIVAKPVYFDGGIELSAGEMKPQRSEEDLPCECVCVSVTPFPSFHKWL
jgi:hypothetical protein